MVAQTRRHLRARRRRRLGAVGAGRGRGADRLRRPVRRSELPMSPMLLGPTESLEDEARDLAFELRGSVDDRTRTLLGRRPAARRAWLVRRSLLAADLFGLSLAFLLARLLDPAE